MERIDDTKGNSNEYHGGTWNKFYSNVGKIKL